MKKKKRFLVIWRKGPEALWEIKKMTRYEKGFLTKCAEYGLSEEQADGLMKRAFVPQMLPPPGKIPLTAAITQGVPKTTTITDFLRSSTGYDAKEPASLQARADKIGNKNPWGKALDNTVNSAHGNLGSGSVFSAFADDAIKHTQLTNKANAVRMRNARARAAGLMAPRQFKDDGQW